MDAPLISVVIGSLNRLEFIQKTINSIRAELQDCNFLYEIIVVDGGSTDGTTTWLLNQIDVLTIVQHNTPSVAKFRGIQRKSWGYFMNLAFKCAQGKYICMLSDDCLVVPNAIKNGISIMESELSAGRRVCAGAFYWRNWPEDEKYYVKITLGGFVHVNHGIFLRSALKSINFVEENDFFFYHADADITMRLSDAGYEIIDLPGSYIEHFAHATELTRASNSILENEDWLVFLQKWKSRYDYPKDNNRYREYLDPFNTANLFVNINAVKRYKKLNIIYYYIKKNSALTNFLVKMRKKIALFFL